MTAKEKNKFNQMQELDKKRFQTEMQVYNQVQNCECFCSTQLWCKHSSHIEWLIYWVFHLLQQTTKQGPFIAINPIKFNKFVSKFLCWLIKCKFLVHF